MIRRRWCWLELCHVIVTVVSSVTQCHEPPPPVAKILRVSVRCGVWRDAAKVALCGAALQGFCTGGVRGCGAVRRSLTQICREFAVRLLGCCCVRAAVLRWTGGGAGADCTVRPQPIAALHCLRTELCCPHPAYTPPHPRALQHTTSTAILCNSPYCQTLQHCR